MKKLILNFMVLAFLIMNWACKTSDVAPEEINIKHSNAKVAANFFDIAVKEFQFGMSSSMSYLYTDIKVRFVIRDASGVSSYRLDVMENNNGTWIPFTTNNVTTSVPSIPPYSPNAKDVTLLWYNQGVHPFLENSSVLHYRIVALDASGNQLYKSHILGGSANSLSKRPSTYFVMPRLRHYHTKTSGGNPYIVLNWNDTYMNAMQLGYTNASYIIEYNAGGVWTTLYDKAMGANTFAPYRLLSNTLGQNQIVVTQKNNTNLVIGSQHQFRLRVTGVNNYPGILYSTISPTYVPNTIVGCQAANSSIFSYEIAKFGNPNGYEVFVDWGASQGFYHYYLGLTKFEYKPQGTLTWLQLSTPYYKPQNADYLVLPGGIYDVRITPSPNLIGGGNVVYTTTMTI